MLLRQQAITLRAIMALTPVKARSPTAFTVSGHTIRGQEPISGQTDTVTRAPKLLYIFGAGWRSWLRASPPLWITLLVRRQAHPQGLRKAPGFE
jgi:hypothetical protein